MAHRLTKQSLGVALRHLCRFGDTDILPHLQELAFFSHEHEAVVEELHKLDLDSYVPFGAIESLAPKGRYAFRLAHQLSALDTVLLLAAVVEIADDIEGYRLPKSGSESYSYRFEPDQVGGLFSKDRNYRSWLLDQLHTLMIHGDKTHTVVLTDISEFYSRVNLHRLENSLDQCSNNAGAVRYIKKALNIIRAKQSYGLPVGGSAARVLAELSLCDVDRALKNEGFVATRYVDDFRIFLRGKQSAYDALCFLAEQLGITEGLSLNPVKTRVLSKAQHLDELFHATTEVADEAHEAAFATLAGNVYFDEEPDPEEIDKLSSLNLLGYLDEAINAEAWDLFRIKTIFRALKVTKPEEAQSYIIEKFESLVPFAKETCLLMQVLEAEEVHCFDGLREKVIAAALQPPASSLQGTRSWLLEILVRGIIDVTPADIKQLAGLGSVSDKRQLLLIRGRAKDQIFFRNQKTKFDQFSPIEQPFLVWGASCLPDDEFDAWMKHIKPMYSSVIGPTYLAWVKANKKVLFKIASQADEHPD